MSPAEVLLQQSADELETTAAQLVKVATELKGASKSLDGAGGLRGVAAGVQAESHRLVMAAMTTRAVSERLATVAVMADSAEVKP